MEGKDDAGGKKKLTIHDFSFLATLGKFDFNNFRNWNIWMSTISEI